MEEIIQIEMSKLEVLSTAMNKARLGLLELDEELENEIEALCTLLPNKQEEKHYIRGLITAMVFYETRETLFQWIETASGILAQERDFLMESSREEIESILNSEVKVIEMPDKRAIKNLIIFVLRGFRKELEDVKAQSLKQRIASVIAE